MSRQILVGHQGKFPLAKGRAGFSLSRVSVTTVSCSTISAVENIRKGLLAVLSSPQPRVALEIGVASKLIAESSLSMLGLKGCCPDARVDFLDKGLHPLTRANNNPYTWLATLCWRYLRQPARCYRRWWIRLLSYHFVRRSILIAGSTYLLSGSQN